FFRPVNPAAVGVEAEKVPHRAERVDLAARDDGGCAWAGGVADPILARGFVLPDDGPINLIKTQDSFDAGDARFLLEGILGIDDALVTDAIRDVDLSARDGRAGVTFANRGAPAHFRASGREFREDALLAPDAVSLGAQPLRPIVCASGGACERQAQKEGEGPSYWHSFSPCVTVQRKLPRGLIGEFYHYRRRRMENE